jgi:hypothetical protein
VWKEGTVSPLLQLYKEALTSQVSTVLVALIAFNYKLEEKLKDVHVRVTSRDVKALTDLGLKTKDFDVAELHAPGRTLLDVKAALIGYQQGVALGVSTAHSVLTLLSSCSPRSNIPCLCFGSLNKALNFILHLLLCFPCMCCSSVSSK